MTDLLREHFARHRRAVDAVDIRTVRSWIDDIANISAAGGTIYIGGNGGSATQASHFTGELIGAYRDRERAPRPAVCLNQDLASVTAVANDFGYETVMARELFGLARKGDCFLGITTSGRSSNVLRAIDAAENASIKWFVLSGANAPSEKYGKVGWLTVRADDTPAVQEVHLMILHCLAETIERVAVETNIPH